MWCWLNHNSGAIQGVSTVLSLVVTAILVAITWRYVVLTNKLANTAQEQFKVSQEQFGVAQEQFALSQKQFAASFLPELHLAVFVSGEDPQEVFYEYANVGRLSLAIKSLSVVINSGTTVFEHHDKRAVGYVLAPTSMQKGPFKSHFRMPQDVWSAFEEATPTKLNSCLTVTITVSDVAGLLTYKCSMTPGKGYTVTL